MGNCLPWTSPEGPGRYENAACQGQQEHYVHTIGIIPNDIEVSRAWLASAAMHAHFISHFAIHPNSSSSTWLQGTKAQVETLPCELTAHGAACTMHKRVNTKLAQPQMTAI